MNQIDPELQRRIDEEIVLRLDEMNHVPFDDPGYEELSKTRIDEALAEESRKQIRWGMLTLEEAIAEDRESSKKTDEQMAAEFPGHDIPESDFTNRMIEMMSAEVGPIEKVIREKMALECSDSGS